MQQSEQRHWFAGLKAASSVNFPIRCSCCYRIYQSEADFFQETLAAQLEDQALDHASDAENEQLVELPRNCICGAMLRVSFSGRRDQSDSGHRRRKLFDELSDYLLQSGVERTAARAKLLRVIHRGRTEMLEAWHAGIAASARNSELLPPMNY